MARIIGGIGSSHVPTIGVAYDKNKQDHPAWAPLFKGFEPAFKWLEEKKPDVLIVFYNDHLNAFFYDLYPTFAVGVAEQYDVADEGAGRRPLPMLPGHPGLARHIAEQLVNDEFDLSVFQDRPLDHGVFSPLPLLWPHDDKWPGAVIPIEVNVVQYPLPTAMRCFKLGQALRRAVESYPEDLTVAVVGTGGLSHQIHGERTGFNNTEWDIRFIDLIEKDPMTLARMKHVDYIRLGGAESVEVIMWLAMRGALSDDITKVHQNYYLATTTAMTVLVFEENDPAADTGRTAIRTGNPQLEGASEIEGTYVFDIQTATKRINLNRFFWNMKNPEFRATFSADEAAACRKAGLTPEETRMVAERDWIGLVRYGANFFVLEKFARLVGETNLEVYAEMRGETFEEFLATRQVPDAR
ncbi:gallate dioxygenase [Polymorphum gilvum]|uniref:Protocatechuate 4,5-dioxygenase beta chain subunit b protein n=1 Tax=Polymorphum gilvum (strain LMG 25793 / CGMCC 1.9160 / SL003B-26A1) TaxID=991905 RepID=F2IWY0_POLGS|nr:gallate dioxygenase [Polymorphum gilvum]ADZ71557.1 Protocatechuate 4,5-dioxygenase beta chain subunit b protein [Polymorphum gilvum SL003B-26A1]